MAQLHYEAFHAPQRPAYPQDAGAPRYAGHPRPELHPQTTGFEHSQAYPHAAGMPQPGAPLPGHGYPQPPASAGGAGLGRLVNLAGAALSVLLLVGVGVWSYRLMVRDVTGVPVIRALDGPIRVSPQDPGGRQAAYQGLAVNTVAAQGEASGAAQTIALAPPPLALSDEDRAAAVARTSPPVQVPVTAPVAAEPVAQAAGPVAADPGPLTIVPASVPGTASSPFPRPRPSGATGATGTLVAAAPLSPGATDAQAEAVLRDLVTRLAAPSVTEIDPTTLAPGTRLVQLGAYDSEQEARAAWADLAARFPAYLDGRGRIIEPASAGGRTFYRLRAHGFADEPEARRFCAVFLADSADCIPVLIR